MSPTVRVLLGAALLVLLAAAPSIEGSSSGKHNQASTGCTCHYNGGGITATNDFPTTYNAGQVYNINIGHTGGTQAFVGGFNVVVDKGTLQNAGTGVQIQSGISATHSGSSQLGWTFDWQAPVGGSGTVSVNIAVLQGDGNSQNSGDAWDTDSVSITEIVPQNQPPIALNLRLMPDGNVPVNEAIMISYIFDDADGDSESNSQIRWSKDGVLAPAYNDMMTLPSSATSVGETWTVSVTPNDGTDFGSTENCPDSAVITDIDSDGDGTMDMDDAFPDDPDETTDSDGDGVGDNADAFPQDASETLDSDSDGVGDNTDQFPNNPTETTDSDGDGVGDNGDAFPNDATETLDSDGDLVGNNADAFPFDATETTDTDGDGVGDNADAFPTDAAETQDTDGDGVGDNADAFPTDAAETLDSDGDGVGDNADAFPNDATETLDTDGDGVGDNADAFPQDATETLDSDNDTVGDNADVFPQDASETLDSDNDTVGNNADAFPNDATETTDLDGDGVGDNADVFPQDASETLDSDNDTVGDNADAFPNDATETADSDGDGVGDNAQLIAETLAAEQAAEDEAAQKQMMTIIVIAVLVIGGAAGAVLFLRKRGSEEELLPKDFTQQSMPTPVQSVQQTYQQPVVQQPVQETFQQPAVVAEPTVLRQWTDEAGYTWRAMDDGSNYWWTGTEWQKR